MASSSSSLPPLPRAQPPRDDDPAQPILDLDAFPEQGQPKHDKPASWDFYASIGSPKHVVAPMVDQSELAWRILSRRYSSDLVYTPMINSRRFTQATSQARGPYNDADFYITRDKTLQEEGSAKIGAQDTDEPVFVQFCANDPELLLQAAKVVEPYCHAVDLNLGCPQHIARKGHYGSFLQSDWHLIFRLINTLHINLRVPVTAKMRVFDSTERTIAYAKMLERAGAQIITVHGRTREMKGHKTGLADWLKIKAVKEAVKVPVFANGNVLYHADVQRALDQTGADGVMSAEGNLYNPAIFQTPPTGPTSLYPLAPAFPFPRIVTLVREYIEICESLNTPTVGSAVKGHLFRLARPALEVHRDLRPLLGRSCIDAKAKGAARYAQFRTFLSRLEELLQADEQDSVYAAKVEEAKKSTTAWQSPPSTEQEPYYVPHWLAQPYYRKTLPPKDETAEAADQRKEKRKARVEETAAGLTPIDDIQSQADAKEAIDAGLSVPASAAAESAPKRLKEVLEEAQTLKSKANDQFLKGQYEEAILTYTEALNVLPPRAVPEDEEGHESDDDESEERKSTDISTGKAKAKQAETVEPDEEQTQIRRLRAVVYANVAACHSKLEQDKETVVACNEALQDDPTYVKALHRRAQANERLGTWSSLSSALQDAKAMLSSSSDGSALSPAFVASLHASVARLTDKVDKQGVREQEEMMGKLKGIGDSVLGWFGLSTDNFQMQKGEGGGYSLNFVR